MPLKYHITALVLLIFTITGITSTSYTTHTETCPMLIDELNFINRVFHNTSINNCNAIITALKNDSKIMKDDHHFLLPHNLNTLLSDLYLAHITHSQEWSRAKHLVKTLLSVLEAKKDNMEHLFEHGTVKIGETAPCLALHENLTMCDVALDDLVEIVNNFVLPIDTSQPKECHQYKKALRKFAFKLRGGRYLTADEENVFESVDYACINLKAKTSIDERHEAIELCNKLQNVVHKYHHTWHMIIRERQNVYYHLKKCGNVEYQYYLMDELSVYITN